MTRPSWTTDTTSFPQLPAPQIPAPPGRHRVGPVAPTVISEPVRTEVEPEQPSDPPLIPPTSPSEPVIIAHAITVILGALVTAGWVAIPDSTITLVGTVVALVLSTVGAVVARSRVTPTASLWEVLGDYLDSLVETRTERKVAAVRAEVEQVRRQLRR